jgi:hypothetical protein
MTDERESYGKDRIEMNEEALTCGTCRNWIKLPPNIAALKEVRGQCRAIPPQAMPLYSARQQMTSEGMLLILTPVLDAHSVNAAYPVLPPEFPACGQHVRRETWQQGNYDAEEGVL